MDGKAIRIGGCAGLAFILAFIPAIGRDKDWKGKIRTEGGVKIVENPKTPMYPPDVFELQEEYIIPSEGPGYHFANPARLLLDGNKNLYIMDMRDDNIKVFDERGRYLRTIGRRGAGPGEFEGPTGMVFFENQLIVHCLRHARLTHFDPQGKVLKTLSSPHDLSQMSLDSKGNIFAIESSYDERDTDHFPYYALHKFSPALKDLRTIAPRVKQARLGFNPGGVQFFAVTGDDRIMYGLSDEYELKIFDNDGGLLMKITKNHEPIPLSQDTVAYFKKVIEKGVFEGWDTTIPKYFPPFNGITADEEGRLYVQTTADVSKVNDYDVFSPEGRFLATVKLRSSRDPYWANHRLYAIDEDEDGYRFIRVSRVIWKYERFSSDARAGLTSRTKSGR